MASGRIGGIVLCGGKSTRMGAAKATLPFGPELMLQCVVRLLSEVVQPIVVVAAPEQLLPPLPAGVLIARDEQEGRGPLQGLLAGLTALAPHVDAAFATSCDVPLLKADFVRRMIEQLGDAEIAVPKEERFLPCADRNGMISTANGALIPSRTRFHHPLAAVYRTTVISRIADLLAADRLRPVFLFESARTVEVTVDELRDVDPDLHSLMNLNFPEDYRAALTIAGCS